MLTGYRRAERQLLMLKAVVSLWSVGRFVCQGAASRTSRDELLDYRFVQRQSRRNLVARPIINEVALQSWKYGSADVESTKLEINDTNNAALP